MNALVIPINTDFTALPFDPFSGPAILQVMPPTMAQKEIWLSAQQGDDASCAFNEAMEISFDKRVDTEGVIFALNELSRRHSSLRSTFSSSGERLIVSQHSDIHCPVTECNITGTQLDLIRHWEVNTAFDLESGPLWRCQLVLHKKTSSLFITFHHIVVDGWSLAVLFYELGLLYRHFVHNEIVELPEVEHFTDYVTRVHSSDFTATIAEAEQYWLGQFAGPIPVLELPTDFTRPALRTYNSHRVDFAIPDEQVDTLKKSAAKSGTTLFTWLLAAYNVFLYRISGQTELAVGIPAAGQSVTGMDYLVGHCVNMLPIRQSIPTTMSFEDFLKDYRKVVLDAYEHQEFTFSQLLGKLDITRDRSHVPMLATTFNIDQESHELDFGSATGTYQSIPRVFENFEWFYNLAVTKNAITIECSYNRDLFTAETIKHRLSEFTGLLCALAEDPSVKIEDASLHSSKDQQLFDEVNNTNASYLDDQCSFQLFESLATSHGSKSAVVYKGEEYSYDELNRRSNKLSNHLISIGTKTGDIIALYLNRTKDMLVTLLAVQKTGACYLPLDPDYPTDRIHYILNHAKATAVITESSLKENLPISEVKTINLDTSWDSINSLSDENPNLTVAPTSPAYVIYTSGSTGNPKGVTVSHKNVTNFLSDMQKTPGFTSNDRLLAVTTLSFDIAVLELFLPLITGGTVVISDRETALDGYALSDLIASEKISVLQATPSTWRCLLAAGWKGSKCLKALIGGEALPHDLIAPLLERTHSLWNMYGPTETTVWSTCMQVEDSENPIRIGKPIANTTLHLLDDKLRQVPVACEGELYIGGDGVSIGYIHQPDLTAERFIPDPFSNAPNARLYRTGDLCRIHSNGLLEYIGRIDNQVKLRGYRIELGEIETTLTKHKDVSQCIATVCEIANGDSRLIAYYTAHDHDPGSDNLRTWGQQSLPDYMIPQHHVFLNEFPQTPNGKIDRKALPKPVRTDADSGPPKRLPTTDVEKEFAEIWKDILILETVFCDDNLFSVGGHSLLALRIIAKVRESFGIDVPLRLIMNLSFEQVASHINTMIEEHALHPDCPNSAPISLAKDVRHEPYELTTEQLQIFHQEQLNNDVSFYNIYEAIDIHGPLNTRHLIKAVDNVVNTHEAFSMRIINHNGEFAQQLVAQTVSGRLSVEKLNAQEAIEDWTHQAKDQSFDLMAAAPFRFRLLQLSPEHHRLVIVMHHLFADGWSMAVILRGIAQYYNSGGIARQIETRQFIDFVAWRASQLTTQLQVKQQEYWEKTLKGLSPLELPFNKRISGDRNYTAKEIRFDIPNSLTQQIDDFCGLQKVSPFNVLLAAFVAVLHRYTNTSDIAIAIAHSGRNHQSFDDSVGYFVKTLIARINLQEADSFQTLASKVKDVCHSAFSNQDTALSDVVRALKPARTNGSQPFSPFLFLLQNIPDATLKLDGLDCENHHISASHSDFDLTLEVIEQGGKSEARIIYSTELYDIADMERLAQHYLQLLQAGVEKATESVGRLQYLSMQEQQWLLKKHNATEKPYPSNKGIEELIWSKAIEIPDKRAISYEGQYLTYAELTQRADLLAAWLKEQGVQPDQLIGVCLSRGLDLIVSLLGIMRVGAAYLPLDPDYPADRVAYILQDANAPLLISETSISDTLPVLDTQVMLIDKEWPEIASTLPLRGKNNAQPGNLAYVIYTSGSTGRPKGVQLARQNLCNFICAMQEVPGLNETDRLLAVTTISFDIAVLELYLPLMVGAEVEIASREMAIDGDRLARRIHEGGVTVLQATPVTWRLLLESEWRYKKGFKALVGGEALPRDIIAPMLERVDELWNMYGPTETTVWSTCIRIQDESSVITVGKPIANTEVYILGPYNQPCPVNIPGELCIGGDGVARGYINQPALTAEKFVANPFSEKVNARLYRTGDSVRWLENGELEFISRLDNQIKLRGYRIELGEIESVLSQHESVDHCVVIVRDDDQGSADLQACLVTQGESILIDDLRNHLQGLLPDYMIPRYFTCMDEMPYTPNGKIDRKALPAPSLDEPDISEEKLPRSEAEKAISASWSNLIGSVNPAYTDKFFEIGGHSLLAMKFISEMQSEYKVKIPLRSLLGDSLEQIALQLNPNDIPEMEPTEVAGFVNNSATKISNKATFVESCEGQIFTQLHYPGSSMARNHAVLICNPIGHEYMRSHRSLQQLAQKLSERGFHVLRFDYYGTGDSEGRDQDVNLNIWQADIQNARQYLMRESACQSLSIIGVRFGATLAASLPALASDKLILWDPIVSGGSYMHYLRDMHKSMLRDLDRFRWVRRDAIHTVHKELLGYRYSADLQIAISNFNLDKFAPVQSNELISLHTVNNPKNTASLNNWAKNIPSYRRFEMPDTCYWYDTEQSENALLPHQIQRKIVDLLTGKE